MQSDIPIKMRMNYFTIWNTDDSKAKGHWFGYDTINKDKTKNWKNNNNEIKGS